MNLGAWFFSDKMVLAMTRARPVAEGQLPQLRRMVEDLARAALAVLEHRDACRGRVFGLDDGTPAGHGWPAPSSCRRGSAGIPRSSPSPG